MNYISTQTQTQTLVKLAIFAGLEVIRYDEQNGEMNSIKFLKLYIDIDNI